MTDVVVDVAMPAYRRATFIGEAIESVLSQSHASWRLTVCDNGPGGGEVERAVEPYLADPRIAHLVTGRDLPLAENWTKALNAGASPYVALLNDDDRWHPDFLGVRVEALERHPECGFAFGEWMQIREEGRVAGMAATRHAEGVLDRSLLAEWFTRENPLAPSTALLRRSALAQVGSFFDARWYYCDWEMWARLSARFPCYYVARQDSDFRRHGEANTYVSQDEPAGILALTDHLERLFRQEVPGFGLSRRERARARSQILLHSAMAAHQSGGWHASSALYRQALLEYPPALFGARSRSILAGTLLGRRLSHTLRALKRRVST